jgi:protein phosphatase
VTVLRAGSASDVGRVRAANQDAVFASATLFAVADGMGGHVGGEVASSTAIEILERSAVSAGSKDGLVEALKRANKAIAEVSINDPSLAGMGTTMVVASLVDGEHGDLLVVANVGDSRAYLWRKGSLAQITLDHSVAGELMKEGSISEAEAARHPQRHVLTRALGIADEVTVDLFDVSVRVGDRLLLCSDGLSDEVSNEEMERSLASNSDPNEAAEDLVRRANANGGVDNISVVVIDVLVAPEQDDEPTMAHVLPTAAAGVAPPLLSTPELPGSSATASPVSAPEAPTPAPPAKKEGRLARRRRLGVPRLLTFRLLGFVLLVGIVLYGGWYFLRWYATNSYYVTTKGSQVVIYQGRPGGVLWFKPKLVDVTGTTTAEVLAIRVPSLQHEVLEPSLGAAKDYVRNLTAEFDQANGITPTPTTSTTLKTSTPKAHRANSASH